MKTKGFTLIELLVAVAIISILVAVALPQYKKFIMRTKRVEGIGILNAVYKHQTSHFAANDEYWPPGANPGSTKVGNFSLGNQLFGLGPWNGSFNITPMGWVFDSYITYGGASVPKSTGYQLSLWNDLNPDNFGTEWLMIKKDYIFQYQNCPDGFPFVKYDDILGTPSPC